MPEADFLEVRAARFPLVSVGGGPRILFVHGAWADHRIWCGAWKPVSCSFEFLAVTQRHFGLDHWHDDKPFSRRVHTEDLLVVLGELKGPVHLVGWSYAGGVLLRAAASAPSLVHSLTIYEPSFESEAPPQSGQLRDARDVFWKELKPAYELAESGELAAAMRLGCEIVFCLGNEGFSSLHEDYQRIFLDNCHTILPDLYAEAAAPLTSAELAGIHCPVLILCGERTHEQYRLMARSTLLSIDNACLSEFPGVGHGGPIQRPDLLAEAVIEFVGSNAVCT
jgi:pimeloyl-ACP methyl ester carboxylesterase